MKLFAAAACALAVTTAHAWDANAHKVIGVIAYRYLTPAAKAWCDKLLATMPDGYRDFLNAAPFPDYLKYGAPAGKPKIARSRKYDRWHYVDFPVKVGQTNPLPADTSIENNGDNVLYGIGQSVQNMTKGLESTRGFYLAMLIHLVGDVHQPLHAAERDGDKGGNDFEVDRGSIKNLHALWDDALTVEFRLRSKASHTDEKIEKVASQVEADVPLSSVGTEAADLDPRHWALESYALAVKEAYAGIKPGAAPGKAYEKRWLATAERRVALAGYRLAAYLNKLAETNA